jgi:preprotein translocase subunit SecE
MKKGFIIVAICLVVLAGIYYGSDLGFENLSMPKPGS